MKQFIIKLFVFILPILGWFIIEGLLPSNTFTWRPWESLLFRSPILAMGDFYYPNKELNTKSFGDLSHHTPYAIPKVENWKIDIIGNRNDTYIADPDILVLGDSYAAGDRITQDSTITNRLKSDLASIKIYNIAPAEFSKLDYYLKYKLINKPKLVIYIKSERYIPMSLEKTPEPPSSNSLKAKLKAELKQNNTFNKMRVFLDKAFRMYSRNWVQARLYGKKGDGIPGTPRSNMYFWNIASVGKDPNVVRSPFDFEKSAQRIITFKEYCDSLEIEFLFVPIPNKATVYFENVPYEKQPTYIASLDSMLNRNNVKTVNVLQLYNDYRESNTKLLYHLDDSHWNSNGVQVVSKEIAKTIISDYANLLDIESSLSEGEINKTISSVELY